MAKKRRRKLKPYSPDIGGGAVFNDARVEVARVLTASFDQKNVAFWTTDVVDPVH